MVMEAREMVGSFERLDYVVKACFLYERIEHLIAPTYTVAVVTFT